MSIAILILYFILWLKIIKSVTYVVINNCDSFAASFPFILDNIFIVVDLLKSNNIKNRTNLLFNHISQNDWIA